MADQDVYEMKVGQTLHDVSFSNTFYYEQQGSDIGGTEMWKDLVDSFQAVPYVDWKLLTSDELVFRCFMARKVLPTKELKQFEFDNDPGDAALQSLPAKNAVVLRFQPTGVFGRKAQRRIWIAGQPEQIATQGRLLELAYTARVAAYNKFLTVDSVGNPGGVTWKCSNITTRDAQGDPLTYVNTAYLELMPRLYNRRGRTQKVCV